MPRKPNARDLLLREKPRSLTEEEYINRIEKHFQLGSKKWLSIAIVSTFIGITVVTYGLLVAIAFGWASLPESTINRLAIGALTELGGWVATIVIHTWKS